MKRPSLLVFLVALLPATLPCAQEPAQRPRERVLQMEDGRVLRAKARRVDGGWEVRSGEGWIRLEAESVRSVQEVAELLAQASKLDKASRKGDVLRRVAYCDWLVRAGLHVEALKALDKLLDSEPDQPQALELLQRAVRQAV